MPESAAGRADQEVAERQPDRHPRHEDEHPGQWPAAGHHRRRDHEHRGAGTDVVGRRAVVAEVAAVSHEDAGRVRVGPGREEPRERNPGERREQEEHPGHGLWAVQAVPSRVGQEHDADAGADSQGLQRMNGLAADLAPTHDRRRHDPERGQQQAHHEDLG